MSENFYNVLGVNENATKEEIKKAYRGLQMKWHPDKNNGSEDSKRMSEKINEAYEILGDHEKKQQYDNNRNNPNPFARMNHGGEMEVPIDEIFNMFFGGAGGPGNPFGPGAPFGGGANVHIFHGGPMGFQQAMQKPPPIIKTLNINIKQVLTGDSVPMDIERWIMENGIKLIESETIYVTIPQGIDENEIIILRDKGNVINDRLKGDLKIIIKVTNDTDFKRNGLDLMLEKEITLKDALCGFSFDFNYLNGKNYTLNNLRGNIIPPEYKKIYPTMGLTRGEHKGNMIIHFHIKFPEKFSEEQIQKLEEVFTSL